MSGWFEADKNGLAKQAKERGPAFVFVELVANALDERFSGVTKVDISVEPLAGRPYAIVRVEDNSPRGYGDHFAHAWTMFAESYKRSNPQQSGQFNFGCKLWLSLCQSASIATTSGTVVFDEDGRHEHPRQKREVGTVVEGIMYAKRSDLEELERLMLALILPEGVTVTFNGRTLEHRRAIKTFEDTLPTQYPDDEGVMRPTSRKTTISVLEVHDGETPMLYELGVPVVESPCNWHVNIGQKVPLNKDRDNVTPIYARKVKTHVANNMVNNLSAADARWAQDVLADGDAKVETINTILDKTEGKNRVVFDPRDKEANARAQAEGATVIPGNRYTKEQWEGIRRAGETPAAGHKFATPKPWSDDPNAKPADFLDESEWTAGMKRVAEFSKWVAKETIGVDYLGVAFALRFNDNSVSACYGRVGTNIGKLEFNLANVGKDWFDRLTDRKIELIVHELAHHLVSSHFNRERNGRDGEQEGINYFYDACCRVGVQLASLAIRQPEKYQCFVA